MIEPSTAVPEEYYALVTTTRRRQTRWAAGCVTLCATAEEAQAARDEARGRRPAIVYGPAISSEGQRVYYLVQWL